MKNIWNKRTKNCMNTNAIYDILEIVCVLVLISPLAITLIAIIVVLIKSMIGG